MNRALLFLPLIFLVLVRPPKSAVAQVVDSSAHLEGLIDSTIAETYSYRFDDALKTTSEMIASYRDQPVGYLYRCGVYWKMMNEMCTSPTDSMKKKFIALVDHACRLSAARLDTDKASVTELFYYAGALVYRARYEMMKSDWLAVLSDGLKTRKLLERAVRIDPTFYDAYSGIGAFNYYIAHIPWYLRPVALVMGISGNEQEGIEQLKIAAKLGKYTKTEAAEFLASVVYPNKGEFEKALKLLINLHREYPRNLYFVRTICSVYYKMGEYDQAIHYANLILNSTGKIDTGCETSLIYIRYYRGASYEGLNDNESAVADFKVLAALNNGDYACRQAKTELDRLRRQ